MSISRQEEIIAALWTISAILAFGNGFPTWGLFFAIKAVVDMANSIFLGVQEDLIRKQD